MKYPTMEEVETATHEQICRWYRFLQSPGWSSVGKDTFNEVLEKEAKIIERICERLKEFGGFTPEISKRIGFKLKE